ncbi:MAG: hypothetical protein IPO18_08350 [bacterium]|nr:hypothetical protein [bacterium]
MNLVDLPGTWLTYRTFSERGTGTATATIAPDVVVNVVDAIEPQGATCT